MYTLTMSSEEMLKEYMLDLPEIRASNELFNDSEYVNKLIAKNRKTGYFCVKRQISTLRRNRYLNVSIYNKNEQSTRLNQKWDWQVYSIALIETPKGTGAITFYEEIGIGILTQAHFFKRYKERIMKEANWKLRNALSQSKTLTDIIGIYIERNPTIMWINTSVRFEDKSHVFAPVNDGVALIQCTDKLVQVNTFITESMYSNQQKELVNLGNSMREVEYQNNQFMKRLFSLMEGLNTNQN